MLPTDPTRDNVHWIATALVPAGTMVAALEAHGIRLSVVDAQSPGAFAARWRIIACDGLEDAALAALATAAPGAGTLWLARCDADERRALAIAAPDDEVVRAPTPDATLALRLHRLRRRAAAAHDPDIDALTRLPSRRGFGRHLRSALLDLLPGDWRAVLLIDLDHFKSVNDRYGHFAGDLVLATTAGRLRAALAPDDTAARLGGDEFVVLMGRLDASTVLRDAERLRRSVAEPIPLPDHHFVNISASAGLVMLRPGQTEPQVVRQADEALLEAKRRGRDRLEHFELVHDDADAGPDADLRRFEEVTRVVGERMTRMVGEMGRRLVEAARTAAMQDALTGARNRGYLNERLPREIERARAAGRPLALALIDIDHFHDVNATYGWPTGDAVLRRFVELAGGQIRVVDWLTRYGGEEFAVVLPDTGLEDAFAVLERLRAAVASAEFTALDGRTVPVTISAGVALLADDLLDIVELIDRASDACLQAKRSGRNRVVVAGA